MKLKDPKSNQNKMSMENKTLEQRNKKDAPVVG